ncbi:hypothetical protein [Caballeronia telluris]|uniref:hypothetical protein n=1 Tax=Caballeronia telluris TaxID=326475 RepID=UPI000AA048E2|nr:hypothetical protein [Caballeronia telluris]
MIDPSGAFYVGAGLKIAGDERRRAQRTEQKLRSRFVHAEQRRKHHAGHSVAPAAPSAVLLAERYLHEPVQDRDIKNGSH